MKTFDTVAKLKLAKLKEGQFVETGGYYTKGDAGGAKYLIVAPQAFDGYGDHELTNGNVAVLQISESVSVKMLGAKGDGVVDDTPTFTFATLNYRSFDVEEATYLIDELAITLDYASVRFIGDVVLKAKSNNKILFRQAASFSSHEGTIRTNSNGKSGVWGMACAPVSLTQTVTLVQNNANVMPRIIGDPGLTECVVLQAGPEVGGAHSGCWYNQFPYIRAQGAVRGVWLRSPPNAGSPCNRNQFQDVRIGTSGGVSSNTGIQIDAGDTNDFYSFKGEGILNNTGPNAVATAIKILDVDPVTGAGNNHNKFYGGACEACTRDLDVANVRTEIYGLTHHDAKSVYPNGNLITKLGGSDSSVSRQIAMGIEFTNVGGDTQPDSLKLLTGKIAFPPVPQPTADPNTLDDYAESIFTPTILFGGGEIGNVYAIQDGFYTKIGREVHFRMIVGLAAKGSSTGGVSIGGLPFTSDLTAGNFSAVCMRIRNISFVDSPQGYISTNTNSIILEQVSNAGTVTNINDTNFVNNSSLIVSGSYMT